MRWEGLSIGQRKVFLGNVSHHSFVSKWPPWPQLFSAWPLVLLEYIMGALLCILVEGKIEEHNSILTASLMIKDTQCELESEAGKCNFLTVQKKEKETVVIFPQCSVFLWESAVKLRLASSL